MTGGVSCFYGILKPQAWKIARPRKMRSCSRNNLVRILLILSILHPTTTGSSVQMPDSDEDLETATMIREILGVQPKDVIPNTHQEGHSSVHYSVKTQRISSAESAPMKDAITSKQSLAVVENQQDGPLKRQMLIEQELSMAQAKLNELGNQNAYQGLQVKFQHTILKFALHSRWPDSVEWKRHQKPSRVDQ